LNIDTASVQTVKIRFQTGVETTDTLTLTEISSDTNVFEVVAIVEENGTPYLKDGKIQALPGQTITFTYNDQEMRLGNCTENILITVANLCCSGSL
jgi:hypothetical protein